MNIIHTNLVRSGDEYYVTPFGAKIRVGGLKENLLKENQIESGEILLGVRPEHITLAQGPGENAIPVKLEVNEMMGSELHLHVYTEDGTRLIVRVPTIGLTEEQREGMVNGAELYITFEGKVMHFFTADAGKLKTNLLYGPGEEAEASMAN